jgi:hypothetical protein
LAENNKRKRKRQRTPRKKRDREPLFYHWSIDILILLLCLAGMGYFARTFYLDITATLRKLGVTPIGNVDQKREGVERRFAERVIWDQLRTSSDIYSGDFIRTGARSTVDIGLITNDHVQLSEHTLTRIMLDENGLHINVITGSIRVITSGEDHVRVAYSDNEEILIEGGSDAVFEIDDTGTMVSHQYEEGKDFLDDVPPIHQSENTVAQLIDGQVLPREVPPPPPPQVETKTPPPPRPQTRRATPRIPLPGGPHLRPVELYYGE